MVLSDRTLRQVIADGELGIDPFDPGMIQPASIDVRLDNNFLVFTTNHGHESIDPKRKMEDLTDHCVIDGEREFFVLHPGEFALGATLEYVKIPEFLVCRLEGKSSLGRLGLNIHSTAGFIDPGFEGQITLELSSDANLPIRLYPGMKVGQLSFFELTEPAEQPYGSGAHGSKYLGQRGPTASRSYLNFPDGDREG